MLTRPEPAAPKLDNQPEIINEKNEQAVDKITLPNTHNKEEENVQDCQSPSIAISSPSSVLYMMVIVTEGINIPGLHHHLVSEK